MIRILQLLYKQWINFLTWINWVVTIDRWGVTEEGGSLGVCLRCLYFVPGEQRSLCPQGAMT